MANQPIPTWYEGSNATTSEVKSVVSFGQVNSDEISPTKEIYFWNNRAGTEDVAKMEDVTFTVRDRTGGLGDTVGNIVEAVRDNWFEVRVDTLTESNFTPVGKGGTGSLNPSGVHKLGTTGTTVNINADSAVTWTANAPVQLDNYIKPVVSNGFIYKVVQSGTTDGTEPVWNATENTFTSDGTARYIAVLIAKTPEANEILGLANNTLADGSNADLAGGNFVKLTTRVNIPLSANSGLNPASYRASWKFV